MELTLDDTLKEILKMMADEGANPIVANFSNFGYPGKAIKIELIDVEVTE